MVTNLLLAQENRGLQIPEWVVEPNESRDAMKELGVGGEGVEPAVAAELSTGLSYWEKYLLQLEAVQLVKVTISLVSAAERKALVRMAWIEEELRRREDEHNRDRVARQKGGEAVWTLSRKGEVWLRERASRGNLEAVLEMERRGYGSELEHKKWRELNRRRVESMRKAREEYMKRAKEAEEAKEKRTIKEEGKKVEVLPVIITEGLTAGGRVGPETRTTVGRSEGIERELEVMRVGPNPLIIVCRYWELASERLCKVWVKSNAKFIKGMKFKMREPNSEEEYLEPWVYDGKLPRMKGRW
jgi:hypothetical protein